MSVSPISPVPTPERNIYEFALPDIAGQTRSLEEFRGKVLLIVNVASRCVYTAQYAGLETLYQTYRDRGLVVLGFPANNFLFQEPGSDEQIAAFCSRRYQVTFPMFSKISVRGTRIHPLYRWLVEQSGGTKVEWNFAKFLIDREGKVVVRFHPSAAPESPEIRRAIEDVLGEV